jgi:hypothetical protein
MGSLPGFSLGFDLACPINCNRRLCVFSFLRLPSVSIFRVSLVVILAAAFTASAGAASTHKKAHAATTAHTAAKPAAHSSTHAATHSTRASHAAAATQSDTSSTGTSRRKHGSKASPQKARLHGQQSIQPERATEIQQALIREHYLSKEADGVWDSETEAAMLKYQADQGWQTRLVPDSRAIKKLGLGPDYSNAINARSGNFSAPVTPAAQTAPSSGASDPATSGFAAASGISR